VNYCNCEANYTITTPSGQNLSSNGGCIQDAPDVPPWCPVVEATCSYRPPRRNGGAWDVCRGALSLRHAHKQMCCVRRLAVAAVWLVLARCSLGRAWKLHTTTRPVVACLVWLMAWMPRAVVGAPAVSRRSGACRVGLCAPDAPRAALAECPPVCLFRPSV